MGISKRLKTIAEFVTPGYRAADIGTDHGYVPICLLRTGRSPYVIAADLSPGSLEKARENAARTGFQEQIDCRLSDGLSEILPGETDSIIISGMGGILMDRILRNGIGVVKSAKELILSPHRDVPLIREFAKEFGFTITEEVELEEKGKRYTIIKIRI